MTQLVSLQERADYKDMLKSKRMLLRTMKKKNPPMYKDCHEWWEKVAEICIVRLELPFTFIVVPVEESGKWALAIEAKKEHLTKLRESIAQTGSVLLQDKYMKDIKITKSKIRSLEGVGGSDYESLLNRWHKQPNFSKMNKFSNTFLLS